jgi:hypothetical protein
MLDVLRPDRGGEAVGAVVHQRDGFLVVAHLHDADDGPKLSSRITLIWWSTPVSTSAAR